MDAYRQPENVVDVAAAPPDVSRNPFSNRELPMNSQRVSSMLSDMEPISGLSIPGNWRQEVNESAFGNMAKSVSFFPPDAGGTAVTVYDRGFPVSASDANRLQTLLNQPPHQLTQTELNSLGPQILGTAGDASAFKIKNAQTMMLNGKKVLSIEGDWQSGKKFMGIYVPKEGNNNRQIQEMYFEGTEPNYTLHRDQALETIKSVKWKK